MKICSTMGLRRLSTTRAEQISLIAASSGDNKENRHVPVLQGGRLLFSQNQAVCKVSGLRRGWGVPRGSGEISSGCEASEEVARKVLKQ